LKSQARPCPNCAGEKTKIVDGRQIIRNCKDCIAQSLVKCDENPLGVMSLESAKKLCSCLDNNHQGGKTSEPSKHFLKIHEQMSEHIKQQQEEQAIQQQKIIDLMKKN